jgi:hypothetical protein
MRLWRAWVELTDRREPPTALALVRIAIGMVAFCDLLHTRAIGVIDALWSQTPTGFALHYTPWFGLGAHQLWWLATLSAAAIAIGLATRIACVVFVLVTVQFSHLSPYGEAAIDMVFRIVLLILALSRCNARWSIDAAIARRLGHPPPAEIPAWPRYLLMFQLVWIYFSAGQNKSGEEWGPLGGFTALADACTDPHAARFAPGWLTHVYPLTQIGTALTICFELCAPLYLVLYYFAATRDRPGRLRRLCNRWRLRWMWLALGVTFELGLVVLLRLGEFPWGMLALYPVLLRPGELERNYLRNAPGPAKRASSPS